MIFGNILRSFRFNKLVKKNKLNEKLIQKKFTDINYDINSLRRHIDSIKQDQFAKAHLDQCRKLEDRITTAFKEWEKIIDGFYERIKKLEEKKEE